MMTETYPADNEAAAGSPGTPVPRSAMAGVPSDRRVMIAYIGVVGAAFLVLIMARRSLREVMP